MTLRNVGLTLVALSSLAIVTSCATTRNPERGGGGSAQLSERSGTGDRVPASLEDSEMTPFTKEFAEAQRFSPEMALSDRANVPGSRLAVLIRWLRADPARVRDEIGTLDTDSARGLGSAIGHYRLRSQRRAQPTEIVLSYRDAQEILANTTDFLADDSALVAGHAPLRPNDPLNQVVGPKLSEIEKNVDELVARLIQERAYEGRDLAGRAFARIDVVDSLGRLLPYLHNTTQLGLRGFGPHKASYWGRNWRDAIEFNLESDRRLDQRAIEILRDVRRQKAEIGTGDERDLLNMISRAELTQTAVAHVLDVVLRQPQALQSAKDAVARGDEVAFDAVIAEALRLKPIRPLAVRIARRTVQLASGREIVQGRAVLLLLAAANRDPATFARPDQFELRGPAVASPLGLTSLRSDAAGVLAAVETKAILRALLRRPGLRVADGDHGQIDRRNMIQPGTSFLSDEFRYTFPEKFAVEWDIQAPSDRIQVANHHYLYESYLQDFDRVQYRMCLSAQLPEKFRSSNGAESIVRHVVPAAIRAIQINRLNLIARENQDLFFCRLNAGFRQCILDAEKRDRFHHLEVSNAHERAAANCQRSHPLTPTESAFYDSVMLGKPFDASKLSTEQSRRTSGDEYQFEDQLVFYNRYTARESMLNPVGMIQFKEKDRDLLFYVRLNLDFRGCMGLTVALHNAAKKIGVDYGRNRPDQYEVCKNGRWNQQALRREGGLSKIEKYYYERFFLDREVSLNDIR